MRLMIAIENGYFPLKEGLLVIASLNVLRQAEAEAAKGHISEATAARACAVMELTNRVEAIAEGFPLATKVTRCAWGVGAWHRPADVLRFRSE